jgi:dethiobiotin synthetase
MLATFIVKKMLICKQQGMLTSLVGRRALVVSRSGASGSSCFSSSTSEASDGGTAKYWKKNAIGRYQRPIYVAATRQHVGKTSVSLALVSGLQKRFDKVGFVKPVGQQHVTVNSENLHQDIRVDKDVVLVRERFHLDHIDYQHMSPVIIPAGYTKKVVDGEITYQEQLDSICNSVQEVTKVSDVVLCEGTGHCGVGSIVGANNAKIASLLGADVVLVANGGLGK